MPAQARHPRKLTCGNVADDNCLAWISAFAEMTFAQRPR
jgi:hypothetical protein